MKRKAAEKSTGELSSQMSPKFVIVNRQEGDRPVKVTLEMRDFPGGIAKMVVATLVNPNAHEISGELQLNSASLVLDLTTVSVSAGKVASCTESDDLISIRVEKIPAHGSVEVSLSCLDVGETADALATGESPDADMEVECCYSVHHMPGYLHSMCSAKLVPELGGSVSGIAHAFMASDYREAIGTERYAEFHENGYQKTESNPLSTFGLDVDTASYATMRRYLNDYRSLPPKESVRLEEFVNYFHYNYDAPGDDAPIAVNCELAGCPWNADHQLLRVGVQAKRIASEDLPPSNLVFLLDVSGSMCSSIDMLKRSMLMLVDQMRKEDSVAIVTYADGVHLRLKATTGANKNRIRNAINALRCGGCTYGEGGIQMAYAEARKNFDAKKNNRVVLVTDGDFNVGACSPAELEKLIRKERGDGIFLSVLGVGMGNYHDNTLKQLSTAGKGNYAFIDDLLEAKKVLVKEFGGSMYTVAKDVKLQLEFNPAKVQEYRLLGYECRKLEAEDFNDDKKDGGEIGSGHSMTALYELVPVGAKSVAPAVDPLKYGKREAVPSEELLTVKLRYKEPLGKASRKLEYPVMPEMRQDGASADFRFASAVAELALLLSDSKFKGSASFDALIERARASRGEDPEGERAEFVRLAEEAQLIENAPPNEKKRRFDEFGDLPDEIVQSDDL